MPWQEFRDEELWVREVNLVFDTNKEALQKVYRKYLDAKKNYLTYQDAINMMTKDSNVGISIREATQCFGMSKMTVKNEMDKVGAQQMKRLTYVEFLEYIGRIAYEKYKMNSEPLYVKIEKILDLLFPMVNATRKEMILQVQIPEEESDESLLDDGEDIE